MSTWNVTPREFAILILDHCGLEPDQPAHPEDIRYAFEVVGESLAAGIAFANLKNLGIPARDVSGQGYS